MHIRSKLQMQDINYLPEQDWKKELYFLLFFLIFNVKEMMNVMWSNTVISKFIGKMILMAYNNTVFPLNTRTYKDSRIVNYVSFKNHHHKIVLYTDVGGGSLQSKYRWGPGYVRITLHVAYQITAVISVLQDVVIILALFQQEARKMTLYKHLYIV